MLLREEANVCPLCAEACWEGVGQRAKHCPGSEVVAAIEAESDASVLRVVELQNARGHVVEDAD
eukprot:3772267-Prorocentrum_lima.AAC.1